jgi:hypothetical protein
MDRRKNRQTDRRTKGQRERRIDNIGFYHLWINQKRLDMIEGQRDKQTHTEIDGKIDRRMDIQIDRKSERQKDREKV